jgi:hypothetical protein
VEVNLMVRKLLIVAFVLGLAVNALAQLSTDGKTVYVTKNDIKVRKEPPTKGLILVSGPGKEVFTLQKGAEVVLLEKRVIESVLSKTVWVRIKVPGSPNEGWMYWGEDDEKESVNLTQKGGK